MIGYHVGISLLISFMTCGRGPVSLELCTLDDRAYSSKKEDCPRLPLFEPSAPAAKSHYLNKVPLLVLDDLPTWRSMNTYAVNNEAQMQLLASAEHTAIPATPSGPAHIVIPKISKTFISYIAGLVVTTPYYRENCDDCIKGLAEPYAKACLATLNTIDGKAYKKYLQEKLMAWFALFPENRAASKERSGPGAAKDSDGERDEGRDDGEEGRIVGVAPELD
jgi:hypothetical protein